MRTNLNRWVFALCVVAPMGMALCGEPTSKTVEVQDVRSGARVVGKTEVQRWTCASYSTTRVLVFDQDTLKAIE